MRNIPLNAARTLGKGTRIWKGFPILYIIVIFLLLPVVLFGIFSLFDQDSKAFTVLGAFIVILFRLSTIWLAYLWRYGGLKQKVIESFESRQKKSLSITNLPDDIAFVRSEIARLKEHTGLGEAEPEYDATTEKSAV